MGVREREWLNPFLKFRNGKGMEKNPFPKFRNGAGMKKKTFPNFGNGKGIKKILSKFGNEKNQRLSFPRIPICNKTGQNVLYFQH